MLQRVFVDADVLASRTQYEWLALLRDETGSSFQLHSSSDVVVDAVRVWRRRNPAVPRISSRRRLDRLVASLDEVVGAVHDDVDFDGEGRRDVAVHDDAVAAGAHVLLSSTVRDVGGDILPFEIYTPDQFFCLVDDTAAAHVRNVTILQEHRIGRRGRGVPAEPLADALVAAGCPAFAERVSSHLRTLAG